MQIRMKKLDILWGYAGKIFAYANSLLLLPFILHFLSGDAIGLWYIFLSLGGIVNLFSFGFNPTFARNIAYAWSGVEVLECKGLKCTEKESEPNWDLFENVIGTCKWIYLSISVLALVLLLTIGTWYIGRLLRNSVVEYAYVGWLVYCISIFINLLFGYYDTLLLGIGAVKDSNQATVWSKLLQFLIALVLLFLGYSLLAVAIANCLGGFVYRILAKYYFRKNVSQKTSRLFNHWIPIKKCKDTISRLWPNTWRDGIVQISSYLTTQATTLICSLFFSLSSTGAYSIAIQIGGALSVIAYALYTSMQPSIQSSIAVGDVISQKKDYAYCKLAFWLVFCLGGFFIIIIGIPLLRIFKSDISFNTLTFVLVLIYNLFFYNHLLSASFISNYNTLPYVKAFIISGIFSVLLSVISAKLFPSLGIYSLIISQILVQACYNNWKWPIEVYKCLSMTPLQIIRIGYTSFRAVLRRIPK